MCAELVIIDSNSASSASLWSSVIDGRSVAQKSILLQRLQRVNSLTVSCLTESVPRTGHVEKSGNNKRPVDLMQCSIIQATLNTAQSNTRRPWCESRDLATRPPAVSLGSALILRWQQKRYGHVWFFLQSDYRPNFQFPIIISSTNNWLYFYTLLTNSLFYSMYKTGCLQAQHRISTTPILLVIKFKNLPVYNNV